MTTVAVLTALARRWYIVLLGVTVTAGVMVYVITIPGVYTTRVDVILIAPKGTASSGLVSSEENLISAAGLLERLVNRGAAHAVGTSQDVPLEGTGVHQGASVRLPNAGGQWDYNFIAPVLSVQVVGPTEEYVRDLRDSRLAEIDGTLREIQLDERVPSDLMITTRVVPDAAPIVHATGRPTRALAGVLIAGAVLTVFLTIMLDRQLLLRQKKKSGHGPHRFTV